MSRRDYPRLGSTSSLHHKKQNHKCSLCDATAVSRIDVQTDWFRGDDDVFLVCDRHLTMAENGDWKRFYADVKEPTK